MAFRYVGNELAARFAKTFFPPDMEEEFIQLFTQCEAYTMTSMARMYCLYKATEYVVTDEIPGDIVECGVWRGGSSMLCALTLLRLKETARKIYLYDTYAGMSEPTEQDVDYVARKASHTWSRKQREGFNAWAYCPLETVQNNLFSTGYPPEKLVFVKGKVEDTIPGIVPDRISLLRLDTDFYASTHHELVHLFPRLSKNGVIILDDYGHWLGAREAADRYFAENAIHILLNRIDHDARIGIKA